METTTPGPADRLAAERAHRARLAMVRRVVWVPPLVAAAFALNDVLMAPPGTNVLAMVGVRAGWTVMLLAFAGLVQWGEPSPAVLVGTLRLSMFFGGLMFAVLAVLRGGIGSLLGSGIFLPAVAVGPVFPQRFGPALITGLLVTLGFVVGIEAATLLGVARGWDDPVSVEAYRSWVANGLGSAVLGAWISRTVHGMHLEVLETRDIGRYRLRRKLGTGGMGEVWAAWHTTLRREVALEILRPAEGRLPPEAIGRFEREVRATTQLSHPNTVRIFDYGISDEGIPYYAMELLVGETLAHHVRRTGPMDPRRAVRLMLQVARALAEAHDAGIVHRDIKPENLFLARIGQETDFPKLLDFGIARTSEDTQITRAGMVAGTPAFLAPELISGRAADPRSDVYACGVTLYYAVTGGRFPFENRDVQVLIAAILAGNWESLSRRLGIPIPGGLEELVASCLARDPSHRPADGGQLASRLAALLPALPEEVAAIAPIRVPEPPITNETMVIPKTPTPVPSRDSR